MVSFIFSRASIKWTWLYHLSLHYYNLVTPEVISCSKSISLLNKCTWKHLEALEELRKLQNLSFFISYIFFLLLMEKYICAKSITYIYNGILLEWLMHSKNLRSKIINKKARSQLQKLARIENLREWKALTGKQRLSLNGF